MTKEEFLKIVDNELERLENDSVNFNQLLEQLKRENRYGNEFKNITYQLSVINREISMLKNLLQLPAYSRIQAMSDVEIEEYKRNKIAELELKIQELDSQQKQEESNFTQLQAEMEQIKKQLGSTVEIEREKALYQSQQLQTEMLKYNSKGPFNIFAVINRKIEQLKQQQEQIRNKSYQEIKDEIASSIKESNYFTKITDKASSYNMDVTEELLLAVASNPDKARQMANLLTNYRGLIDEQRHVVGKLPLLSGLPQSLQKLVAQNINFYNFRTMELFQPDKLLEMVNEFEESFNLCKDSFINQFTASKLSKLVGKEFGVDSTEVDFDFLQLHNDKLGVGQLENLKSLVAQRDLLTKKVFKTRETKMEIERLNAIIIKQQSLFYRQIIGWYQSQSNTILGLNYQLSFSSLEQLQLDLNNAVNNINNSQQAIAEFKKRIIAVQQEMKDKLQSYEPLKNDVASQIRNLAGPKFDNVEIPYPSHTYEGNIDKIIEILISFKQNELVNRVQAESHNQVVKAENEIISSRQFSGSDIEDNLRR